MLLLYDNIDNRFVRKFISPSVKATDLSSPHITRFSSYEASDRLRYETMRNRRGSCHLTEIGTLAIQTK